MSTARTRRHRVRLFLVQIVAIHGDGGSVAQPLQVRVGRPGGEARSLRDIGRPTLGDVALIGEVVADHGNCGTAVEVAAIGTGVDSCQYSPGTHAREVEGGRRWLRSYSAGCQKD